MGGEKLEDLLGNQEEAPSSYMVSKCITKTGNKMLTNLEESFNVKGEKGGI